MLSWEEREHIPLDEQLNLLLDRLDEANATQTGSGRKPRLAKLLKREITKVRRQLALKHGSQGPVSETDNFDTGK